MAILMKCHNIFLWSGFTIMKMNAAQGPKHIKQVIFLTYEQNMKIFELTSRCLLTKSDPLASKIMQQIMHWNKHSLLLYITIFYIRSVLYYSSLAWYKTMGIILYKYPLAPVMSGDQTLVPSKHQTCSGAAVQGVWLLTYKSYICCSTVVLMLYLKIQEKNVFSVCMI